MRYIAAFLLMSLLLLASCAGRGGDVSSVDTADVQDKVEDMSQDAEQWADSVIQTLTLRQKVAQMILPASYSTADAATLLQIREYADSCVGGVVLLKGDSQGVKAITDSLRSWMDVPSFVAIDAEWGLAMRLSDAEAFPKFCEIGEMADDQQMYDYGCELARQCRALGINMLLGPVLDIASKGSYMSKRSLGDNAQRVSTLAIAYARGAEDGGVIAVAKHFPGHGSVSQDSHKNKGVIRRTVEQMDCIDLVPFSDWIRQGFSAIMVGHLAWPAMDESMRPAAVSQPILDGLLRTRLGFNGLIITDALNMGGVKGYNSADAIEAGADMVIAPANTFDEIDRIVQAVEDGRIRESNINKKVKRILFYKYLYLKKGHN